MGIGERLFGKRGEKRGRGPARSAAEREKIEELRFLRELKRTDPQLYRQMMLERIGLSAHRSEVTMETVMRVKEYLNAVGLKIVPSRGGSELDDDSLRAILRDIMPVAAPLIQQALAVRAAAATSPPSPPAAEQPPSAPAAEEPVSLISQYVIGQFSRLGPEESARWLLSQQHPAAGELLQRLQSMPDEQIPALLDEIAQSAPDLAGVIAWLRQRPRWLMDLVRALRDSQAKAHEPPPRPMGF